MKVHAYEVYLLVHQLFKTRKSMIGLELKFIGFVLLTIVCVNLK